MVYFRQIAFPVSFLAFIWQRAFDETGIIDRLSQTSSAWFWVLTAVELLLMRLITAGMIWGGTANYRVSQEMKADPAKGRRVLIALGLLTAASIPNLLVLVLVADRLSLPFRQVDDLGIAIVVTPAVLGLIGLNLQELASRDMFPETIDRNSQEESQV
jgi:hypothetical protein